MDDAPAGDSGPTKQKELMKKPIHIIVAQLWTLELAQEIGMGFMDYAGTKMNWECLCLPKGLFLEYHDQWKNLDGLVIAGEPGPLLENSSFPVIATHWDPDDVENPMVDVDPEATGILAAEHLLAGGHRRLAVVSQSKWPALKKRAEAFAKRCWQDDVACEQIWIEKDVPPDAPFEDLLTWIRSGDLPVAVFCSEDATAHRLLRVLREAGLHIPDDVAVLGCEDDLKVCKGSFPALSSVHLPYRQVGFEAARMLDAKINGNPLKDKQIFLPPGNITERLSTNLIATSDPQLRRAIEFIRRHACENITAAQAARHAGLTARTLQSRFHAKIGHGPSQEIQRIRLTKAKELLRQTPLSLDEIADATGYHSGHYLSKIFKRKVGQTARKYRATFHH